MTLARLSSLDPAKEEPFPAADEKVVLREVQLHILESHPTLLAEARKDPARRASLETAISRFLVQMGVVSRKFNRESLARRLADEMLGYGPIESLVADPEVTEIMVNGPYSVYVERQGRIHPTNARFRDDDHVLEVINRIVAPLGRRIDISSPFVDARLPDGSRVNAIIPPLAIQGPTLTIRKFSRRALSIEDLVALGTLSREMVDFLGKCVMDRKNLIISGGAGTGKTTLLGALCEFVPPEERVITIEDCQELKLRHEHVVGLEARPPNTEGKGEITMRQLLRNALRMRPDRIIVGEVRGPEVWDMVMAMNTGHEGSMTTVHANSVRDALRRLEVMAAVSGEQVAYAMVKEQILAAVDVLVHLERVPGGTRKATQISLMDKTRFAGGEYCLIDVFGS